MLYYPIHKPGGSRSWSTCCAGVRATSTGPEQALAYYRRQCLAIREAIGPQREQAIILENIAWLYSKALGQPEEAIRGRGVDFVLEQGAGLAYSRPGEVRAATGELLPPTQASGDWWGRVQQNLAAREYQASLTPGGASYFAERSSSSFPAGATVYALVDSVNHRTNYGNVAESNESNNLAGPVSATGVFSPAQANPAAAPSMEGLPGR